ncbi:MAG: hypothetical protein ABR613_06155, partial [Actinomycetota bacterium]
SNGGADKPNGPGGVDKADQDGNNGCGNDDDFEDDNEGWCGGKPKPATSAPSGPCDADATMPGLQPCVTGVLPTAPCPEETMAGGVGACEDDVDVLGGVITRPATPTVKTEESAEVLGERLAQPVARGADEASERGAVFAGRQLPFTGSGLPSVAGVAVCLLLIGAGILAARGSAG